MNIKITDDFDLQKIADSGQCFRVKAFPDGMYRFITGSNILYIKQAEPGLYQISCTKAQWRDFWRQTYEAVLPGYHQNKEHWNTVILDGTIPDEDIKRMIAESYDLIVGSKRKSGRR